jgi:hypothetical protein
MNSIVDGREQAREIMMDLSFAGTWLKDENFNFLEISEKTANMLFDKTSDECIWRNDFDISREAGLEMSEELFDTVCRASDNYASEDKPTTFIEFITDTKGEKHIWETIKSTKIVRGKKYYYGYALFLDVIFGSYELAYQNFLKQNTVRINDNLFYFTK